MEERNLRPRPRNMNTRRKTSERRIANKDDENSIDSKSLFIYQAVVSVIFVITTLFIDIANLSITNDISQKLKYAMAKHTTIENVQEVMNKAKNKIYAISPGVLEIFGFKDDLENNQGSEKDSDSDEKSTTQENDGNITEIEIYNNETNADIQPKFYINEEKKLDPPPEIILSPEEE